MAVFRAEIAGTISGRLAFFGRLTESEQQGTPELLRGLPQRLVGEVSHGR